MSGGVKSQAQHADQRGSDYRDVYLRDYPLALSALGRGTQLAALVTTLPFIDAKLRRFGLDFVLDDMDNCVRLASDEDATGYRALSDALRLARPTLTADKSQLAVQIAGRLMSARETTIGSLLCQAIAACRHGLLPLTPTLTQGDHPLSDVLMTEGELECIEMAPDGRFIVTAAADGLVSVWSLPLRGNSLVQKFRVPDLVDMCLSTDGCFILTGDRNGRLAKWDLQTGFLEASCESGGDAVLAVSMIGDGQVAVLLRFSEVCVVELESFRPVGTFSMEVAHCLRGLSKDRLLVGTADGFIDLFDPQTGQRSTVVGWHGGFKRHRMSERELFVRSMASVPMIAATGPDDIRTMDFAAAAANLDIPEKQKRAFMEELKEDPHRHMVNCICVDAEGAPMALSGCFNGEVALLDLAANAVLRRFHLHATNAIRCCALSTRHGMVVAGSYGGTIRVWNLTSGAEIGALTNKGPTPVSLHFLAESGGLIAGFDDGQLRVWNDAAAATASTKALPTAALVIATFAGRIWAISTSSIRELDPVMHTERRRLDYEHDKSGPLLALTPDSRRVLSIGNSTIIVRDIATGWVVSTIAIDPITIGPAAAAGSSRLQLARAAHDLKRIVVFSYAELLTASTGNYSRLELRDQSGALVHVLDERAGMIRDIHISPDGRWCVTLGTKVGGIASPAERTVLEELRLWDLSEGTCVNELQNLGVTALTFSDSDHVLVKSRTELQRWRLGTNTVPEPIAAIPSLWSHFVMVADVVVASTGDTIEVWNTATGDQAAALTADANITTFCVVDGTVVAGDAKGGVHFLACGVLSANTDRDGAHPGASPRDEGDMAADVLAALDNAAEQEAAGQLAAAVKVWRGLSTSRSAGFKLRLDIAAQLHRLGYPVESADVRANLAADVDAPIAIRLQVIAESTANTCLLALRLLARTLTEDTLCDLANTQRQILCALLQRMVESDARTELSHGAVDASNSELVKVALSHALGRLDPAAAAASLKPLAIGAASITTRVLALEGLRHVVPALEWMEIAGATLSTAPNDEAARADLVEMILRKARIATTFLLAEYHTRWPDIGLLASYSELNNQAMGLLRDGREQEGLALLKRGTAIFPHDAGLHLNLSGLLVKQSRYHEAVDEATKCLEMDPLYEKALNFRAYARIQLEQYEFALQDLNRALELNPRDYANIRNRSRCYEALGRIEEADADDREADRLEIETGHEPLSEFETSSRRTAGDLEEPITDGILARTRELLMQSGLHDNAVKWITRFAFDTSLIPELRETAVFALGQLRAERELITMLRSRDADSKLRILAASAVWQIDPAAARKRFFSNVHKEALRFLTTMVTDARESPATRHYAAQSMIPALDAEEIEQLARAIPDARADGAAVLPGVGVALVLIKSLGPKRELIRLERLARDACANGWLRELASQTLGLYVDRDKARALSIAHLAEGPEDPTLVTSIEHALASYGEGDRFSPDPMLEDAFRRLVSLQSADDVPTYYQRYAFASDPEFINNVERYVGSSDRLRNDSRIRGILDALKALPMHPRQAALREFLRADSLKAMRAAAERVPQLTQPECQQWLEDLIRETAKKDEQPALMQRLEWLRTIPGDEWHSALETLVYAKSASDVGALARQHPFVRSERFRAMVESVKVMGSPAGHMAQRLEWLKGLGEAPEDALADQILEALTENRPGEARRLLDRLIALNPDRERGMLAGEVYLNNGEYQHAIECFTHSIENQPTAMAYERRGKALFSMKRWIEAIDDFTRALQESSESQPALLGRGLAYSAIHNWSAATEDLERVVASGNEPNELAVFSLAMAYLGMQDTIRARTTLQDFTAWSAEFAKKVHEFLNELDEHEPGTDPAVAAFNAFQHTTNAANIEEMIQAHPIFWVPNFQAGLEQYIASLPTGAARDALKQRLDVVLQIVRNPAQLAFDAFISADDLPAMTGALEAHALLREPAFMTQLHDIKSSMSTEMAERFTTQLALYTRALGSS